MVFVAPGFSGDMGSPDILDTVGVLEPLLVDRFEVTRSDWRHWFGAAPDHGALTIDEVRTTPERADWPAFCTYFEAQEVAERRGMRLPTAREWLYLGVGRRSRFPWGRSIVKSIANTSELGLRRPVPVGCFEGGKSWAGVYDLIGNVAEWVEGPLPGEARARADEGYALGPWNPGEFGNQVWAMGGSYATRVAELYVRDWDETNAREFPPGTRTPELGVRCVAEAEAWLGGRLDELAAAPDALTRLEQLGARFGAEALPVLERLLLERPEHPALVALLNGARP